MGKPAQQQENISLARFKRALFFAPIIFWSCINLAGWDHEFRVSSSKNSVDPVSSLRSFMQEGHSTSGGTGHIQRDKHQSPRPKPDRKAYKTALDLLTAYRIDTIFCLSLLNVSCDNMPAYLQTKSYDKLLAIRQSLEKFFKKYEADKHFRKQASKIKQVGIYKTIKIGKKKIWKSRKQIPALKHYANHAYQAVCTTIENIAQSTKILCRDFLKTSMGETAQYFLRRFMMGVSQSGIDIQATLNREKRNGPCDFARDLMQKAKTQPIRETLGDVMQLLSRATINATAVFVAVSAIAVTIETGVAAATGALGAIAAQKFFEPLALSINLDGSVAVESAASSGVSFWQAIATSIAPAVQAFTGVVEHTGNLFCLMENRGVGYGDTNVFIDDLGNTLDLRDFERLKKIDTPVKVNRSGSNVPIEGKPNSIVTTTGGHKLIYNSEGKVLYDISEKRIKVYIWNKSTSGEWFVNRGSKTKIFRNQVPKKLLEMLEF